MFSLPSHTRNAFMSRRGFLQSLQFGLGATAATALLLDDKALLHGALNRTWEWIDNDLTLVTVPGAGHFVHHDKPNFVNGTLKMWLMRDR